jgi:hypothetical protein
MSERRAKAAFYCMSSDIYFLGAVGMINSVRLLGHDEPVYLLDLGLEPWQRELLEGEATVLAAPADAPPWLLKTVAPLAHPAETMVLIDADMVVTRPLGELIDQAAEGRVVAFENEMDRFVPAWGEVLDLGEVRRQPYVCSGLVFAGGPTGEEVIALMDDRQQRVEFERTHFAANELDYPLLFLDQDILNAILASRVEPDRVSALPYRLAPMPPFDGLEVLDERSLRCAYADGTEPFVVHHFVVKPWLEPTLEGVYSRLLRRLLTGPELAIRVPEDRVPLRLRPGALAYLERKRVNAGQRFRWHVGDPLREYVRRIRDRRARPG